MKKGDKQLGKPQILYQNTKANIEAMSNLEAGSIAYAIDTKQDGYYDGSVWTWGRGTGSAGGGLNALAIFDDNIFKVSGTAISFNDNLNVAVSGTVAFIDAVAGGGGANVLAIFDDSIFKVSGTAISFDQNLSVGVTGTTAYIQGQAGGGATDILAVQVFS